ncbi:chaplin [Streptomyces sp. NPDC088387]|uniref:chaplin n=1 Tax=Streptomyces sp. NPDC088387 TaxID=3365859 RepID=UPI00382E85DC
MRQATRKGLMTVAAATGVIAAASGGAHADSGAQGSASGSPGVLSGNSVQAPVHAPVNVCGNTVNVVGVLNPSVGNACANKGGKSGGSGHPGGSARPGGAQADGHTGGSPGVGSGNHVEAPVHVPVNVCGNSVDVIGIGNPTTGNDCDNGSGGSSTPPGKPSTPPTTPETPGNPGNPVEPGNPGEPGTPSAPESVSPEHVTHGNKPEAHLVSEARGSSQLAQTGSSLPMGAAVSLGAGALLAGAVLYRRARTSA